MGDSAFRKVQKILEKPKPPAHMQQRNYQVEISWSRRLWNAVRPPAAVPSDRKPINRSQRRMLWVTAGVVIPAGLGWLAYNYATNAPQRARGTYDAGVNLQALGDFGGAVKKYSESLSIGELPQTYLRRGEAYRDSGNEEKALEDWNTAIDMDPTLAAAYTARGTHYRLAGNTTKAFQDLDESIRIGPSVDALYQRGQVFAALGQFDKAIDDYNHAIEQRREAPYVYLARAIARRALGDEEGFREDQKIAEDLQK